MIPFASFLFTYAYRSRYLEITTIGLVEDLLWKPTAV